MQKHIGMYSRKWSSSRHPWLAPLRPFSKALAPWLHISLFLVAFLPAMLVPRAEAGPLASGTTRQDASSIASAVPQVRQGGGESTDLPVPPQLLDSLNARERGWLEKFYHGAFIFDGWQKITTAVLAKFPPEERKKIAPFIARLGLKIGGEWCRDNDVRRIDTSMLKAWSDKLRKALHGNSLRVSEVLAQINFEVDRALGRWARRSPPSGSEVR